MNRPDTSVGVLLSRLGPGEGDLDWRLKKEDAMRESRFGERGPGEGSEPNDADEAGEWEGVFDSGAS